MSDVSQAVEERALREAFATEDRERFDAFIADVRQAARISADLAWVIAAPVRSHEDLTREIGRLMMRRLRTQLRLHVTQLTTHPGLRPWWTQLVCAFALSAFTARTLEPQEGKRGISIGSASGSHSYN